MLIEDAHSRAQLLQHRDCEWHVEEGRLERRRTRVARECHVGLGVEQQLCDRGVTAEDGHMQGRQAVAPLLEIGSTTGSKQLSDALFGGALQHSSMEEAATVGVDLVDVASNTSGRLHGVVRCRMGQSLASQAHGEPCVWLADELEDQVEQLDWQLQQW